MKNTRQSSVTMCILLAVLLIFAEVCFCGIKEKKATSFSAFSSGESVTYLSERNSISEIQISYMTESLKSGNVSLVFSEARDMNTQKNDGIIIIMIIAMVLFLLSPCIFNRQFQPSETFVFSNDMMVNYIHNQDGKKESNSTYS